MRRRIGVLATVYCIGWGAAAAEPKPPSEASAPDTNLAAARKYVRGSERYLHHSELRRGMAGYGLTVLAGTEVSRFDVEIISVMANWGPHQDVILARLSGQGLNETGIVSGMSGSPVYIRHDGREKLVGAVAFGWSAQKEPLCGIQPITQMLAISGVLEGNTGGTSAGGQSAPAAASAPTGGSLAHALRPEKVDFAAAAWRKRFAAGKHERSAGPHLVPLATPLMVSGQSRRSVSELETLMRPAGILPVRSGGVASAEAEAAAEARLVPGAAVSIPLATGDADYLAIGTVTDVIGDRVLAMGHALFAEGRVGYPMGTAYVHTVVPGLVRSFKVASSAGLSGTLDLDEAVGVSGKLGATPEMIPMSVHVAFGAEGRKQTYRYRLCKERVFTPLLARFLLSDSVLGWRRLPEEHTVRYTVKADYPELGGYRAENTGSGTGIGWAVSDLTRAVEALANNPLDPPRFPCSIRVDVTIEKGSTFARLLDCKLDGKVYRPGETVTGGVTVRPFRRQRERLPVALELPDDIEPGEYTLTACGAKTHLQRLQSERPHEFAPDTVEELFDAVNRVVQPRADRLYLRVPLEEGGLAIGRQELPDLPAAKAALIEEADLSETRRYRRSIVVSQPSEFVVVGSAEAAFEVKSRPEQTRLQRRKDRDG